MKYRAHMELTRKVTVEFDADVVDKKRPYRKLQEAGMEAAIDQELINMETDRVTIPWIENVKSGDDIE